MNKLTGFNYKTHIPLRFTDLDIFGHVNNAVYLTYFEIARSIYLKEVIQWDWNEIGIIIGKAEINFLKPIVIEDEIFAYVKTSRIGTSSFDVDYALVRVKNGEEELCTNGKTVCISFDYKLNQSVPIPEVYRIKMEKFEGI
ncbi:MAG: thioesterase family protein [Daejeonella sp.]